MGVTLTNLLLFSYTQTMTKCSDMLNNHLGCNKGEANQKQQLSNYNDYICDYKSFEKL